VTLDELGESLDSSYDTIPKYRERLMALSGVDILDNAGEFRSTYDIISDLADKWQELSSTEQAAVTTMIAGVRQQNVFSSLIQEFGEAEKVMSTIDDSGGAMSSAYEIYSSSIEAAINRIDTAFQKLSSDTLDSNFASGIIDAGAGILTLLDSVIEKIGVLPTLLGSIGAILGANGKGILQYTGGGVFSASSYVGGGIFSSATSQSLAEINKLVASGAGVEKISAAISTLPGPIAEIANGLDGTPQTLKSAQIAAKGLGSSFNAAAIGAKALNIAINVGLMLAISAAIKGVEALINMQSNAAEKAADLASETKSKADDQISELNTLDDLIDRYEELKSAETIDASGRSEIRDIQEQINALVGGEATGRDLVNGKLDEELSKLQAIALQKAKDAQDSLVASRTAAKEAAATAIGSENFLLKGFDYAGKRDKAAEKIINALDLGPGIGAHLGMGGLLTTISAGTGAEDSVANLQKMLSALKADGDYDWANSTLFSTLNTQLQTYQSLMTEVDTSEQAVIENSARISALTLLQNGTVVDSTESYVSYRQAVIDATMADKTHAGSLEDVTSAVDDLLATDFPDYAGVVSAAIATYTGNALTSSTAITTLVSKSSALSDALKQQAEDGYLSADSLSALSEAGLDYNDFIDKSNESYSININKLQESLIADAELEKAMLQIRKATDLKTLADMESADVTSEQINAVKAQIAQYDELEAQLESITSSMTAYKAAVDTANASANYDYAAGTMLGTITDGLESGRIATDEFKAAMSYFTDGSFGDALTQDSIPALQSFFDTISQYTQGGAAGLNAATDAFQKAGLLDAQGNFLPGTTLTDVAGALGDNVGTEFARSLLESYKDYGFDIDIESMMSQEDWDAVTKQVTTTADSYVSAYDKINQLYSDIQNTTDATEKSRLSDQIKNITDSLSSDELTAVINNLQTLQDSGKADVQPQIDTLNNLKTLKSEIDSTVTTTLTVDDRASAIIAAVKLVYDSIPRNITTTITAIQQGEIGSGFGESTSGTGFGYDPNAISDVSGNANAGGQWGSGSGGKTLVGELGRELVVNPYTNRWYTVGDRGAQFVDLPKDAIVFNHIQTEGILGNGSIVGRGKSLVSGNAAASIVSGGIGEIHGGSYKEPTRYSPKKVVETEATLSELYEKENKLLEHQVNLLEDMINLHATGSDEWFSQQQNIIDTYKKSAELAEAEYWRLHALSNGVITDDMQSLMEDLIKYKKEVFDASKEYWEAEKDNAKDTLDYLKSQAQAVIDLKTSYHDLTKSIQAEQREIDSQLKIAAEAYPNLTEAERAAIFSGDDYQALSNQLSAISAEAQEMYTSYLEQIQAVGEDASYELETITDEFERQYELKMGQYNIAKAELGVLKARKNLENVQNERSVAMLVGGLWTWVSDSDNVISAMEDLASAETELADAQSDASFNADTANWEGYISSIDNQIGAIDELVYTMDGLADEIHSLVDSVETQIQTALSASTLSLFSALPNYSGTSTSLFSTTSLQNLWTASVSNAIASAGSSITTSDLIGELLSNMSNYASPSGTSTTNGDVLMWNGNVVASGSDVTMLISMLRSLIPLMPVTS